jgi:hypothetical protein
MPDFKKPNIFIYWLFILITTSINAIGQNDNPFAPQNKAKTNKTVENDLSFSLGFGTSYGGYGSKINYLFSENKRFGLQAGVGYYFGDIMYNGALKIFLWKNLYTDLKYGLFRRKFELDYDENYDVAEKARILSGPGIMLGYELAFFNRLGINVGTGINCTDKYDGVISYSYDVGLLYKF